jgi:hypothetical protein
MSKIRYRYNTKTLAYERAELNFKHKLLRVLSYLATGTVFAGITVFIAFTYFDSPKEKRLKREIEQLNYQYEVLNKKFDEVSLVLGDLQDRDDNIYRVIFEAEPIPDNLRKAGFGGVDRYKELEGYDNSELMMETSKKLDKISKQLYIQSKSFDEVVKLASRKSEQLASIPAIQPISNKDLKRFASGFGYRTHPIYKTQHFHTGIDFTANIGTEIYATGDGTVERADAEAHGYGHHVVVNHGFGYETLYGHMSKIKVRPGEKVKRGDIIGYVGNSGTSTGPHLHYEVIKNNDKINPINFFYNDLSPAEYQLIIQLSSKSTQSFD